MILYHGSYVAIEKPNLTYSRKKLDFGQGFYTTPLYEQAVSWSKRFLSRKGMAVVSTYEFSDSIVEALSENGKLREFNSHSMDWLHFIMDCRTGKQVDIGLDLIIGGVANDKVFDTLQLYFDGLIPPEEALKRLKYNKPNFQYCFKNQALIDNYLIFKKAEVIL